MKGELVLEQRVVEEVNGSTLSAILTPGMRAITVRVNDVIGVGGFLLPGNRVDILASRKDGSRRAHTNIILEDLKVLAVDQTASTDTDKPVVVRAVTLELDPKEAEKLVNATEEGSVQLALRNPLDEESVLAKAPPKPVKKKVYKPANSGWGSVTVIRGTTVDKSKVRL
jgi:pilus assembly protein CpaB